MQNQLLSSVFLSLLLAAPVAAKEVKIPEAKPQVSLAVPDDWTVTFDEAGLQAVSPQTNSFVYGKILKRPKDEGNAWLAGTLAKLQARGVVFKTTGAPEPAPVATAPAPAASVPKFDVPSVAALPVPSVAPDMKATGSAPAGQAKAAPPDPSPSLMGSSAAPAPVAPPVAPANLSVPSLALLNEGVTLPAVAHKGPHFPFHALPYKDTSRDGTPVDVELLTFILPDKSVFFLVQESGQTDDRMTGIINSVKPPK